MVTTWRICCSPIPVAHGTRVSATTVATTWRPCGAADGSSHVAKLDEDELYDLIDDIGETTDRSADEPEIVARLQAVAAEVRADLGDAARGITGAGVRPKGKVTNPKPLTEYNEDHPYMAAMYDLADSKVMVG